MDKPDVRVLAEDVPARRWICCAIEATWGERCPDFDPTCATCRTWAEYDALTATRDTAKAEGRREGLEEAVAHIDYVRANIVISFKDRSRFTERDMNRAFRDALTVARDRITGEDEGLWLTPEEAAIRAIAQKAEG